MASKSKEKRRGGSGKETDSSPKDKTRPTADREMFGFDVAGGLLAETASGRGAKGKGDGPGGPVGTVMVVGSGAKLDDIDEWQLFPQWARERAERRRGRPGQRAAGR